MRARMGLRPPTVDRHIAPTAHPTAHGTARSMLPGGADSYGARLPAWGRLPPRRRALRMGAGPWGTLYPPPEAIRGPFRSPPSHLRLGDAVAPGAPVTSSTYPDVVLSMDQLAGPALEPFAVWVPPLRPWHPCSTEPPVGAPADPLNPVTLSPGLTAPDPAGGCVVIPDPVAPSPRRTLALGGAALLLLLVVAKWR